MLIVDIYSYFIISLCIYAGTLSSSMEPSLSELQQQALFLPRPCLTDLKEIGQGNKYYMDYNCVNLTAYHA